MKTNLLVTTAIPDLLQNIFRNWCVGPGLMVRKPSSLYGRMLQYDKTSRWLVYIKDSIEHTKYIFRKTCMKNVDFRNGTQHCIQID